MEVGSAISPSFCAILLAPAMYVCVIFFSPAKGYLKQMKGSSAKLVANEQVWLANYIHKFY